MNLGCGEPGLWRRHTYGPELWRQVVDIQLVSSHSWECFLDTAQMARVWRKQFCFSVTMVGKALLGLDPRQVSLVLCCNKIPKQKQFKEEIVYLAHNSRLQTHHCDAGGRVGESRGRNLKQSVTSTVKSRGQGINSYMLVLSYLFSTRVQPRLMSRE